MERIARILCLALGLAVAATAALAQAWTVIREDDGVFFFAGAYPGNDAGFELHCGGPSPQNLPFTPRPEPMITKPGQIMLSFTTEVLGPPAMDAPRSGIVLDVDGRGFALPGPLWNEFEGFFEQPLGMGDPLFAALRAGQRLRIVDNGRVTADIPLTLASGTIRRMQAWCGDRWAGGGVPAPATPGFSLADAQRIAETACSGPANIAPGGAVLARMDEDAAPDLVLDYGAITCLGQAFPMSRGAGFCGAALCSIQVYLTGGYRAGTGPLEYLGMGATVRPGAHGRDEIVSVPALASCTALNLDPCQSVTRVANGDFAR